MKRYKREWTDIKRVSIFDIWKAAILEYWCAVHSPRLYHVAKRRPAEFYELIEKLAFLDQGMARSKQGSLEIFKIEYYILAFKTFMQLNYKPLS